LATPAVSGEFIFLITVEAELVAASRRDGRVRWVQQLDRYRDASARRGLIVWSGPLLVGDRLFAVNSNGNAITASAADGQILSRFSLPGPVSVSPAVARRSIFILTDDAQLVALR
jgi:outer membrane protein assembly factor BamB